MLRIGGPRIPLVLTTGLHDGGAAAVACLRGVLVQDATHPLLWRRYPWRIIFFQLYPYSEFGPTIIYLIERVCARGHAREHLEGGLAPSRRNTVKHGTVVVQKAFIESRSSTAGNHFRRPLLGLYPTCSRLWEMVVATTWFEWGISSVYLGLYLSLVVQRGRVVIWLPL